MPGMALQFVWGVASRGYRWLEVTTEGEPDKAPQPALVPAEAGPGTGGESRPEPDPALFMAFAAVTPDKEGVLAFANRHGNLANEVDLRPARRADWAGGSPVRGTLPVTWQHQIADMRRLVGLWDLLRAEDRERLAPHIQWRKDANTGVSVHFDSHPSAGQGGGPSLGFHRARAVIAAPDKRPELLENVEPGDPIRPGWAYLQGELALALYDTAEEIAALMDWDAKRGRPVLGSTALTLRAAVWLQLADAVSNDRTFSRCRECGRWFEVAPDAARTHRRFCSNSCRSRAYRERQDRARQLYTSGKSLEQIAEELDSDAATVRKWVTGFRE